MLSQGVYYFIIFAKGYDQITITNVILGVSSKIS
jgi:hypothetical protein